MAMNKIDGFPFAQPHQLDKYTRADARSTAATRAQGTPPSTAAAEPTQDHLTISDKALKLMELRDILQAGREALATMSDLPSDRMDRIRERLATGYYNSLDVQQAVAGRVGAVIDTIETL